MTSKYKISAAIFASLLASTALARTSSAHIPLPPRKSSDIGRRVVDKPVANFKLTDQDGKLFDWASARGKVALVTFVFTTCPDVCPLFTANFASIQRQLEEKKIADYLLLTITTDPERDSSKVLKDYASRFKADFRRWTLLTGTRSELSKVWKNFGVNVLKTDSGQVQHTSFTTLVDREGRRRVDYYGDKWQEKEVLKDIDWLRTEKQ
jgi:protein SCO1/2